MPITHPAAVAQPHAVVTYIPGPLGEYLDRMRASFPGQQANRAHLTFLPPRLLTIEPQLAAEAITDRLVELASFRVELTEVVRFPTTDVLYLAIGEGSEQSHQLHDILQGTVLSGTEAFTYRPHVTLAHPVAQIDILDMEQQARRVWHAFGGPRSFTVNAVDLVRQESDGRWIKLWTGRLVSRLQHKY